MSDTAAQLRDRAAHARKLADQMVNRDAQADLRKIADAIDDEAHVIERRGASNVIPPPAKHT